MLRHWVQPAGKPFRMRRPEVRIRRVIALPHAPQRTRGIHRRALLPAVVDLHRVQAKRCGAIDLLQHERLAHPRVPVPVSPGVGKQQRMPLPRCLPAQPVKRTVLLPQPLCRRGAQYTRTSHRSGGRRACTTVLQYTQAVLRQKKLRAGRRRYGRMAGRKQCFSRPRVFHGKETSRRLYTLCGIGRRALLPHKSVMHIRLVRKAYAPPPQMTAWQRHGSHNIPGHAVRRRTRAVPLYTCRAGNCLPNSGKHPFRRSLPFGPYREERRLRIQQKTPAHTANALPPGAAHGPVLSTQACRLRPGLPFRFPVRRGHAGRSQCRTVRALPTKARKAVFHAGQRQTLRLKPPACAQRGIFQHDLRALRRKAAVLPFQAYHSAQLPSGSRLSLTGPGCSTSSVISHRPAWRCSAATPKRQEMRILPGASAARTAVRPGRVQ